MSTALRNPGRLKRGLFACLAVAVIAAGPAIATPAMANTHTKADSTDSKILDWFANHGASQSVAHRLLAEFHAGIPWDSLKGNVTPSSLVTSQEGALSVTTATYPDGSISVSKTQNSSPSSSNGVTVTPMAQVGSCDGSSSGSGWIYRTNCYVEGDNALIMVSFRADYYLVSQGYDLISAVRSPYEYTIGGTAATPILAITKANETSTGPATATATTQYSSSATSFTARLTLRVGSNTTSATQNW
jgi:hypothetical protein